MFRSSDIHEVYIRLNKNRGGEISSDKAGEHLFQQDGVGDNVAVFNSIINTNNLFYLNVISSQIAKYNVVCTAEVRNSSAAIKSRTIAHEPSANGTMHFTNDVQHDKRLNSNNNFSERKKIVRILGFMALISYMIVILFTWIYANLGGYVYFSAGEPILSIKYLEWMLGFIGIFVAIDCLFKEIRIT